MTPPMLELSPDQMMAFASLLSNDGATSDGASGEPRSACSMEQVQELLKSLGVCHGIDHAAVEAFVARSACGESSASGERFVLARGTPRIDGKDGELRFMLTHGSPAGQKLADGHVDSRRQHQGQDVRAGDLLAEVTAPTKGSAGKTVCGEVLPVRPGRAYRIQFRENVKATDGGTRFFAAVDGIHFVVDGCIRVSDTYEIRGDVDFHTGDVETRHPVRVTGDVHSTFRVVSTGDVRVGGHVDDGTIESHGSIEVAGGISREHTGMVRAHGSVRAMYAVNAEIRVGGAIDLTDNAYNSHLLAGESIRVVEGSGTIVGGRATATRSIEVKVAGSKVGVPTLLRVGCDLRCIESVEVKLRPIEQEIARIHALLGIGPHQAARSEPSKAARLLSRLGILDRRRQVLLDQRERCLQNSAADLTGAPFILIHDRIMPGVELVFGNVSLSITEESPGGRFAVNQETGEIEPLVVGTPT